MPLSAANFVANTGVVRAADMLNFYNLFTGVMTDQPVTFGNTLTVAGRTTLQNDLYTRGYINATGTASGLLFSVGGTTYWQINNTGMLLANADNTEDIGAAGANRPRNLYLGGNLSAGGNGTINGTLQVTGAQTLTGAATFGSTVTLAADPTLALQAATKQYVDAQVATKISQAQADTRYLQLTGGTVTGPITLPGNPTLANQAANMAYVDTKLTQAQADARYLTPAQAAATYLPLVGGTLAGPGNLTVNGTGTVQGALNANGGVYYPRTTGPNWGSLNPPDRITVWSDSNMYIDTNSGAIQLRPAGTAVIQVSSSSVNISQPTTITSNLQVNGYFNGGVTTAGTININTINAGGPVTVGGLMQCNSTLQVSGGNAIQWNNGSSTSFESGYLYFRNNSGVVIQSLGGSYTGPQLLCGQIISYSGSVCVDVNNTGGYLQFRDTNVRIERPQSTNYMKMTSYDQRVDLCDASGNQRWGIQCSSGQTDHFGINGSTNHRFFHFDTSWMGTQAANFQVQSARASKEDFRPLADRALALICEPQLRGWGFTMKADGTRKVGFVADDWLEFLPEVVGLDPQTGEVQTFDYDQVVAVIWEVVRRLAQEHSLCR